jgi:hypothetical protein
MDAPPAGQLLIERRQALHVRGVQGHGPQGADRAPMRFGGHGPDPATSNRSTADRRDAIAGFPSAWLILAAWHLGLPAALVTVAAALTYRRAKI